jgi:hypothetical protein
MLTQLKNAPTVCWDQIDDGYSIPNMGRNAKVDQHVLDDMDYEGVNNMVDNSKCT